MFTIKQVYIQSLRWCPFYVFAKEKRKFYICELFMSGSIAMIQKVMNECKSLNSACLSMYYGANHIELRIASVISQTFCNYDADILLEFVSGRILKGFHGNLSKDVLKDGLTITIRIRYT